MPKNKSENPTGLMGDLCYSICLRDGKSSGVWDKDHKGRRKFVLSLTIINFSSQGSDSATKSTNNQFTSNIVVTGQT